MQVFNNKGYELGIMFAMDLKMNSVSVLNMSKDSTFYCEKGHNFMVTYIN
jgi:hypothetical protein